MNQRPTSDPEQRRRLRLGTCAPANGLRKTVLALAATIFTGLSFGLAQAQDFVTSQGALSNQDFYRLVACAAPPGGPCSKNFVRWSKSKRRRLTVGIMLIAKGFPSRNIAPAAVALDSAIKEINRVGAGIRLRQIAKGSPDIKVYLTPTMGVFGNKRSAAFEKMVKSVNSPAMAQVFTMRNARTILDANVVITKRVPRPELKSVVLEELVQTLGLITDIKNKHYHGKSIFSQTDSSVTSLGGQDAKAIILHYPP